MTDFLTEENACGQNLLRIVAAGNAIIAEILRLKNFIPDIFRSEGKAAQTKYVDVIQDFSYFKISEAQDTKIDSSPELTRLDEEIHENHFEVLRRAYLTFESVYQYVADLQFYLRELNNGMYIQQNLETVFQSKEGKQLLAESLYLYGTMLLVLDLNIPSIVRERLLVSYYRYSAEKESEGKIDEICMLLRSTGFTNSSDGKKVPNYPVEYFSRIELDRVYVEMVISRLRSEDLYNQVNVYPLPDHRTTALATQAGMLYICLFFAPEILNEEHAKMREIVDKFFSDNWIISIYMGITVNLVDAWAPFKAAKNALLNTIESKNVNQISNRHSKQLKTLIPKTRTLLDEGKLTKNSLMKNVTKVINILRECSVTLRWLLLHTSTTSYDCIPNKRCRQLEAQVLTDSSYDSAELFELLLNVGQLESKVKELLTDVLDRKEIQWLEYRQRASSHISDLVSSFDVLCRSADGQPNQDLRRWFIDINKKIESLKYDERSMSGRQIIPLIRALEEVQVFHNLNSSMQVKQHLLECTQFLHQMIQTMNIKLDQLVNVQIIGDLSYAWNLIDKYTPIMQESIKSQPNIVIKLRSTFLKLASALEIPLLRINQSQSDDLISVSQYYSAELVKYVRSVIQIIPNTVFRILAKIVDLMMNSIKELPTRLDKEKLREYAQPNERYEVAKHTYSISVLTEGVLMMKTTLVGVIELDPKQLLEDGIHKELVQHLSQALHTGLIFDPRSKDPEHLVEKLNKLSSVIDGYKRSFEYAQDYLNIYGFKIWQEEVQRIINYNVEKECNEFLRKKVQDWQSEFQTMEIPITTFPSTDSASLTFIGRLAREFLRRSEPKSSIFINTEPAWYDCKNRKLSFHMNFLAKVMNSIGPSGLIGIDKLYSYMIKSDLELIIAHHTEITMDKNFGEIFIDFATALNGFPAPDTDITKTTLKSNSKLVRVWPKFLNLVLSIGQKQIFRKHIAVELNKNCSFDAKDLNSALSTMNEALKHDLLVSEIDKSKKSPSGKLLSEVNEYMRCAGLSDSYQKAYIRASENPHTTAFLMLFISAHLCRWNFVKDCSPLPGRKMSEPFDGFAFTIGIVTVLKQFPSSYFESFFERITHYSILSSATSLNSKCDSNNDTVINLQFLNEFIESSLIYSGYRESFTPYAL